MVGMVGLRLQGRGFAIWVVVARDMAGMVSSDFRVAREGL